MPAQADPDAAARPPSGPAAGTLLEAAALGGALAYALVLVDGLIPPVEGEPLPLRWARVAADHPVRMALAGLCVRLAARRSRRPEDPRPVGGRAETRDPHPW